MDIGKSNDNFKDGKPKCFNCNKYEHMAKGMLSREKGTGDTNLFQMREERTYCQELQREADDEET